MKQIVQFLALFLTLFSAQSQTVDSIFWTRSNSYTRMTGIKGDSVMAPPSVKASKGKYPGSFTYNPYIRSFEVYDSITKRWYPILSILRDGLLEGGNVSWTGTGLNFYVSEATYVAGGVLYFSNDTTVTLATADPTNPRQDVIALNSIGVHVLTGTPAADPAKPQVEPGAELELTSVLVNAGATTPSGITQTIIWDENTESTATTNPFAGFTINPDNTTNPLHLTKAIDLSSHTLGGSFKLVMNTPVNLLDYSVLVLYVRLKSTYANGTKFILTWSRSSGGSVSNVVTVGTGDFGYVRTVSGMYQTIQIPMSAFAFTTSPTNVDRLDIGLTGAGAGMYIDYIQLQSGVTITGTGVNSFNSRTGNVTPVKADYAQWFLDTTYRRADSVFGKKNGVEYFQFKDSTGSSYTFSNGVKESGGAVTAGGQFEADSISYVSNSNKTFRIQSRLNASSQSRTDWYQDRFRISGKAFNGNVNSFGQIEASSGYAFLYGQSAAGEYGVIQSDAGLGRVTAFNGTVGRQVKVSPTGIDFVDENSANSTNRFEPDSSIHYKRLTYGANYRSLFTPFTLVDKGYVDSLTGTIGGGGEANTASNVGSGAQIFKQKTGVDLEFRSVTATGGMVATQNTNDIAISLPSQTGNNGKYLKTDGSTATWETSGGGSADSTFVIVTGDTIRSGNMSQFVSTDSLIAFGTSIALPTAPSSSERGYAQLVGSMLRLRKDIVGLSGYSMQTTGTYTGSSFYSVHTTSIKERTAAAKFLMFEYGINDASYDEDNPAFNFDTTNYKTQYLEVLAYAVTKGWTYSEMIIVSPEFHESTSISMQNDYFNCTKKFADSLGCFFVDVYTNGMNYYISTDGTHPADYGHQRMANIIVQRLNSVNNVKLNGQNLAVDGVAEFKKVYIRQTDTTGATANILTIESDGAITKSPYDLFPRFFKTIPSIRQSGHLFYNGKLDLTQSINTGSSIRVQNGLNDFSTGAGFILAYFGSDGVLFPYNYGTSTNGNVIVPGGRFLVGGYTSTGFTEGIYSSSGVASTYGVFSGTPAFSNSAQSLTVGMFGGAGWIATYGTSGGYAPTALNPLNNSSGNILIGTTTYNSASSLAVNGKSFFGSAGAASAWVHMAAGTASANTAPLKFTTGTNLTTAEAGAMEYTTPKLYFTNSTAIRQEIPLIQQSRVSTQFDATSNTTLADITGLTASVAASGVYRFEATLYTSSVNTGGVKVAIGGTATATAIIYEGLTTDAGLTTQSRATALGTAVGAVTAVTAGYIKITGTITVNAAGTLTVQFAQNASDATASSVLVGSVFVLTQIN